jgi:hypothetical protein
MTLEDVGPDNWRHCAALEVEMTLLIYPVVVSQGTQLFPDTGPDTALDLVESRSTHNIGNTPCPHSVGCRPAASEPSVIHCMTAGAGLSLCSGPIGR